MKCRKAQRMISESIDGGLDHKKSARLERHLESCRACRSVLDGFRAIAGAASGLESPPPSDAVWETIRGRLAAARTSPARLERTFSSLRTSVWKPATLRYAGAAALALALVASGIFFGIRLERRGAVDSFSSRERYTLGKLDEAERYYLKAIESLSEAFASQQGTLIPEVAQMFERNLLVIDVSIQACRDAVLAEPDDLEARNFLLAAYMDKVSFLNTALDFPGKTPAVRDAGRIL